MSRIGIMGGTFNPIHIAHIHMADAAYKQADLDKVLFMPSKNPPHKDNKDILSEKLRSDMIKLAISEYQYFEYSDFELLRQGKTYSAQTLQLLHKQFPDDEFFFIMGADSFFQIESWYHPEIIMKKSILLPINRDGSATTQMQKHAQLLRKKFKAKIQLIDMPQMAVSSSNIRKMILKGENPSRYLSPSVWNYIKHNNCYRRF